MKRNITSLSISCRGQENTLWQQRTKMVEWLEVEANFKSITGGQGSLKAKLKKSNACGYLAAYVNQNCGTNWDLSQARNRYNALIQNYKECKALFESVEGEKFCLTSLEIANGLTLEQKKEAYCYLFHRIDKLYGTRY